MSAHAGPPSPEVARTNKAWKIARLGRSGAITRADRRRVAKLLRKTASRGGHEVINLNRRAKRNACRRFGISGKRFRALERKRRRGEP